MGKKYLLLIIASVSIFISIQGCYNMAVQMTESEKLYRSKCSSCHNIIEPNRHDEDTWHRYVEEYGKNMTTEEKQLVLQYLIRSE